MPKSVRPGPEFGGQYPIGLHERSFPASTFSIVDPTGQMIVGCMKSHVLVLLLPTLITTWPGGHIPANGRLQDPSALKAPPNDVQLVSRVESYCSGYIVKPYLSVFMDIDVVRSLIVKTPTNWFCGFKHGAGPQIGRHATVTRSGQASFPFTES